MSKRKKKPKDRTVTKCKAEQDYVRAALREALADTGLTKTEVGRIIDRDFANVHRFLAGGSSLSDTAIEALYDTGTIRRPSAHEIDPQAKVHPPMESWEGATVTVQEACKEKGYSAGTIRKWAKSGKLDWVQVGRRIMVVVNEKYAAVPKSEKAQLRDRIAELETENEDLRDKNEARADRIKQLKEEKESLIREKANLRVQVMDLEASVRNLEEEIQVLKAQQLEFDFETPAAAPDKKNESQVDQAQVEVLTIYSATDSKDDTHITATCPECETVFPDIDRDVHTCISCYHQFESMNPQFESTCACEVPQGVPA